MFIMVCWGEVEDLTHFNEDQKACSNFGTIIPPQVGHALVLMAAGWRPSQSAQDRSLQRKGLYSAGGADFDTKVEEMRRSSGLRLRRLCNNAKTG
jgi:hypothetical protein